MIGFWIVLALGSAEVAFPERTPAMIETCLEKAVSSNTVYETREEHRYVCGGEVAEQLWTYLENSKIGSWEQKTESGVWLSREFPMGACFKRLRHVDETPASDGLSCTIFIPRKLKKKR